MIKQERTIIHLRFKESDKDFYFGSISAIYDTFDSKIIGVAMNTLYNFNLDVDKPYTNNIVVIKKGVLQTKEKSPSAGAF